MIWFNLKELEQKIINDEFSDKEGFNYFLAFSILGVLTAYVNSSESLITVVEAAIGIGITIWGSYSIFKTNSSGDGKDFFKRYFALSWVIGFRLFIFVLILTFVFSIIYLSLVSPEQSANSNAGDFVTMIVSGLFAFIYYLLLNNSFRRVSMMIPQ
ncbi:MAG: hypothetical protein AAF616_07355 [Bacteroidota bacterium]